MVEHGFLGIALHARVDGGVNFQAIGVDVIFLAIGLSVLLTPSIKRIGFPSNRVVDVGLIVPRGIVAQHRLLSRHYSAQLLAEIWGNAVLVVDAVEIERQRLCLEFGSLGFGDKVGFEHLLEHHVAAILTTLGVAHRIEVRRVFEHTHQRCSLLHSEVFRLLTEIYKRSRLYANGIIEEVELIEIHLNDFVLGVVAFKLKGNHPLHRLLHGTRNDVARLRRI